MFELRILHLVGQRHLAVQKVCKHRSKMPRCLGKFQLAFRENMPRGSESLSPALLPKHRPVSLAGAFGRSFWPGPFGLYFWAVLLINTFNQPLDQGTFWPAPATEFSIKSHPLMFMRLRIVAELPSNDYVFLVAYYFSTQWSCII